MTWLHISKLRSTEDKERKIFVHHHTEKQAAHLLGIPLQDPFFLPHCHTTQYNHLYRPIQRRATLAERGQAKGDAYGDTSQDVVSLTEAVEAKGPREKYILIIVVFMLYSTSEPKKREIIINSKTS